MTSIQVTHTIDDLESDCRKIATTTKARMAKVVRANVNEGNRVTRNIARSASGIHGLNYFKRISGEMITPLMGEWGPTGEVVGNAVGAGWRHGPTNTDLEKSLDIIGPKFAKEISAEADNLFWPDS